MTSLGDWYRSSTAQALDDRDCVSASQRQKLLQGTETTQSWAAWQPLENGRALLTSRKSRGAGCSQQRYGCPYKRCKKSKRVAVHIDHTILLFPSEGLVSCTVLCGSSWHLRAGILLHKRITASQHLRDHRSRELLAKDRFGDIVPYVSGVLASPVLVGLRKCNFHRWAEVARWINAIRTPLSQSHSLPCFGCTHAGTPWQGGLHACHDLQQPVERLLVFFEACTQDLPMARLAELFNEPRVHQAAVDPENAHTCSVGMQREKLVPHRPKVNYFIVSQVNPQASRACML